MHYHKLKLVLILPVFLWIFLSGSIYAQAPDFDMKINQSKETIDDLTYAGYSTRFDISVESLQRMWWKHSKGLGIVENMKTHYIIKVPSREKGMSPVSLIEKATGDEKSATIFLAVLDQTNNTFKEQVRDVLLAFKVQYYVDQVAEKIRKKEQELAKVSNDYVSMVSAAQKNGNSPNARQSKQSLDRMTRLSYELESLKRSLNQIQ